MFNRYDAGMAYGPHIDDAVMVLPGGGRSMRSDVSFTLFLADPQAYQGGELAVASGGGEQAYKLPRGSLILYPSDTLHQVKPVISGSRTAAIGWVQSEIRDPAKRAILFDLDLARRGVFARDGKNETFDLITKSHANLLRLWAEV